MAKDFQGLLFSISQQLNQQEVNKLVAANHLPGELRGQPPAVVLGHLEQIGIFTLWKLQRIMEAMKDIGRSDLYKQVKLFRKKTRNVPPGASGEKKLNFEPAERQATQVRATLQMMEEAVITRDVNRVQEVYSEAREAADNLVRVIKRANCLVRTLCSAPKSAPTSAPLPPPPEPTLRSLKRSQSENKPYDKPASRCPTVPTIPIPPTPFERDTDYDSDRDGNYDTADLWSKTLPRSLPSQRPTMPLSPLRGKPADFIPPPPPPKLKNNPHYCELQKVSKKSLLVRPPVPSQPKTASVPFPAPSVLPPAPPHNDSDDATLNYEDVRTALASQQAGLATALRRTSVKHSSPNNTTMSSNQNDSCSTWTVDSGFDDLPPTPPPVKPRPKTKPSPKSNHFNTLPLKSSHNSHLLIALPEKDYTYKKEIPTESDYINVPKYVPE